MFCAISQFLDRNANHSDHVTNGSRVTSSVHVTTPAKKPFFSLPNLRQSIPDLLASAKAREKEKQNEEKAREKVSEDHVTDDDAPKHNRRHLPIPSGRYTVGCVDIMCDVADHGTFFRLFYPTNKTDIHKHYKQWPLWLPRKQYVHGYMIFLKKRKIFGRLANLIGGDYHSPVIWLAPLIKSEEKFPVVILTHGIGGNRTYLSTYCADLASHGFVVAAIEHRDGSASMTLCLQDPLSSIIKESNDENITAQQEEQVDFLLDRSSFEKRDEKQTKRPSRHERHKETKPYPKYRLRGRNFHTNYVNRTIDSTNVSNRTMNCINVIDRASQISLDIKGQRNIHNGTAYENGTTTSQKSSSLDTLSTNNSSISCDSISVSSEDSDSSSRIISYDFTRRTLNRSLTLNFESEFQLRGQKDSDVISRPRSSVDVGFYMPESPVSPSGKLTRSRSVRLRKKRALKQNHSCDEEWRPFEHVEVWDDFNYRNGQMYKRAEEISDLLDELISMNDGNHINNALGLAFKTSQFKNRLDLARVAAVGHSFGTASVLATLATDERFKAGVGLDGWMLPVDDFVYSTPSAPVCFLNMEAFQWEQNVSRMVRFQKGREETTPMFTLMGGCHQSMSDFQFIVPHIIGRLFDMRYTLRPDLCIRACVDTSLAFLYKHLDMPMEAKHEDILAAKHPNLISGTNVDLTVPDSGPTPP